MAVVTVTPAPTATLTAAPLTVTAGQSSTLTVASTNAVSAVIQPGSHTVTLDNTGAGSVNVSPITTTEYTLTVTDANGFSVEAKATVTVTPAPTATLTADPETITAGQSSTLTVASTNAVSAVIQPGNHTVSLDNTGAGSIDVSPIVTTVYLLTVTDANSATATATATVTVNEAPTAEAGDPQTVAEGASVTLDGSGSSDPEGEALTYAWTQTSGETVTLSGATTAAPTFTAPTQLAADEQLVFSLIVTDARNEASAADTVTVTVTAGANDAPTADAGDDQTVAEGAAVTLDGSGSTDPEEETLTYAWTQTSGETVTLSGATTAAPTFTAPTQLVADAVLVFSLTVTDARGLASTADTVTVTVTAGTNDAPTADAGEAQTVAEGATVTLDGSGSSDPEEEALTYAWTQTSGETVTLSGATTASPTFTAPTQLAANEQLVFSLTVTDARSAASTADTVTVTVTAGTNDAPTADAGEDQTVAEGASVTLDGSGSTDPEGEALTYAWSQTSGESVTLSGATTAAPTFTAPTQLAADATLVFSLTVTDARSEASTADTVTITVTAGANDAPTADAGEAQTVAEGASVTLDGSGSSDPEGETLTYAWTQTSGETVTLSDTTAESPTFTAPTQLAANEQLVDVSLTVTDARNAASTADTVTVTVTAGTNDAPTADAGDAQTVAEGASVTLDGSGSSDPEGEALTYAWTQTSGETVTLSDTTAASPTFTAPTQLAANEQLVFSLTVTDARNAASTADTVTVTVTAGSNDAPTADAGDAQTVAEGASVTLDGSGSSDPEGETLTYAWSQTSGETVSLSDATAASPTFTAPEQLTEDAVLVFSLTVTDARNEASAADTVTITVTAGSNDAPTAEAGDPQTVAEGATVTLNGSGSTDPEGEALTYAWTQTSGETVTLSDTTAASPTFTAPEQLTEDAVLVFSLTVTDARSAASAADTVTITVTAGANDAPTADAGDDQTVAEGATVTLDGSGSTDPEDEALDYAWTQTSGETVTLSGATTAAPTFTAPEQLAADEQLVFSLTVTDARNAASTADTVTVTVTAGTNDAPTADAGDAQTVAEGASVTLDGSGSSDPEGEALTYAWSQTSGETVTLSDTTAESPTFTAPEQLTADATLVFSLTVTDARNAASAADTVTVTVTAGSNDAPTADAGEAQTVAEGASVTLDGSGSSDPEDEALTYAWTQTSGETVTLSDTTAESPTFTAPEQLTADATLVFSLIVTDARNAASTADTVTVTVTAGSNDAPTADAGEDQTVAEGASVTLDGSGSSDPEDEALTYAWTQTSGETVTLSDTTAASPTFTAPEQLTANEQLVFSLIVTDARNAASAPDTVTVTVTAGANEAPTANAGPDQTVAEGATVTLDGSGSSDPEDEALDYAWTQTSGETVTLSGATTAAPTFTAPTQLAADEQLVFSLIVTDARNAASAADTVTVTVTAGTNEAPTADAGAAQTVAEGATVTLDGSGSSDPEEEALTYAWTQTSGETVTLSDTTAASPTFTAPEQLTADAVLVFSLTVTDARNAASAADTVTITVTAGSNDEPTAEAGDDQTVAEGATVTLNGSGTDPEGEALTYAWTQTSGETVTLSDTTAAAPTFTAPTQLAADEQLVFSLTVTDARNAASAADTVTITVTAGSNDEPTADAGDDQTVTEGATVTLDGSGSSDPEDEALTYAWTQTSGETVTLNDTTAESPTFTAPEQLAANEQLVFSLTVTDARNAASAADTVTITVTAGSNDEPTADAGDDQTVTEGATVTLNGSGSSDPEDEALTYAWTQTSGETVTLNDTTAESPTFTAPEQLTADEQLVFSLTVTDARGLASTADTVTITVTAGANEAPTADAGQNQTVAEGAAVTLDGSGSSDPEEEALSYAWTQTSGETVTLSGATTAAPTFTAPEQLTANATLVFSLIVTDARNAASTADTVTVTVTAGTNDAPTADAGDAQTVAEGASVTLDGSGSSDPEGEALTYAWSQTSGETVTLSDTTAESPTFTAPEQLTANATLVFSLIVTDARNAASAPDTVTVTVTAGANEAPTADAGEDQTVTEGAAVTLDGSGSSDPEEEALSYAWTQTSGETVTLNDTTAESPTFIAPEQLAADATLVFSLIVTDARNAASAPDTVTITVTAGSNDAPTADAGDDQTVAEGATVTLDGSGSTDPEDEALDYAWTQTSGETVTLSGATTAAPTFTAPEQLAADEQLVFSLIVTDARNAASTADTVTITVTAGANEAPTADAGDDQTVAEGAAVTLDGSGSSDPEEEALSYAWTQTSGETVTLNDTTAESPTFTAPEQLAANATLVFSLIVTDARNAASAPDTVTVTVTAGANEAPTADAGEDQTVAEGAAVTLDGSGSSDPEDEALTYAWTQTSGETVTLSGATTAAPTFTAPEQLTANATLVFSLIVTDARNEASAADTVTITVTAGSNDAPTADAGEDQTVAEGSSVTLDGSGSSDPEGEALTYAWSQTSGETVSLSDATAASPTFTAPTQLTADERLVFSLTVTDARNAASTADTVTVTVTAGTNDAPTANAGPDQTVAEGASVTLDGSGSSDPEGETLTYAWTQTSGQNVALSGANTASPTFTAPTELTSDASLVFSLTVTDARNAASTADTVTITVTAGANDAPTADAGEDQTVAEGAAVTLDGSGSSDPEDEALTYAWTQTSGETVTLNDTTAESPTFTAPTQLAADEQLVFSLIVTDARNAASAPDTVTVTVTAGANEAPTADAGDAQTVAEGAAVTLDGSGSSDPEDEALTYAWTQTSGETVTLSGATTASPTFIAPEQLTANATLVFSLIVTDARNAASAPDTVTVTVTAGANEAPTADAGEDQTVAEGAAVTLDGSGSSDPEDEALTYAWTQTSGETVTLSGATTAAPTFTAPEQLTANATLVFSLIVTDARNAASTADTVTVTVTAGSNDAPTADAGDDQTVAEGAAVTLDGSGSSDPEDEALSYAWTQTSGETVTLNDTTAESPTFTAPEQLAANEQLVFSLIVTDARNAASAPDTVTVTVTAGANDAPTADAGDAQTVAEGAAVTLDGSGSSDPEDEALDYAWTQTSGETVTLSGATTAAPTFTAPTQLAADESNWSSR